MCFCIVVKYIDVDCSPVYMVVGCVGNFDLFVCWFQGVVVKSYESYVVDVLFVRKFRRNGKLDCFVTVSF